jgi:hypothetical protein
MSDRRERANPLKKAPHFSLRGLRLLRRGLYDVRTAWWIENVNSIPWSGFVTDKTRRLDADAALKSCGEEL